MRIFVKKANKYDFEHPNYLLIIKDENAILPHPLPYYFYCGLHDGKRQMDKVISLEDRFSKLRRPSDDWTFSQPFLISNIHQVYIITEKEYKMFAKCKTVNDIYKLIDNIYHED